MKNYKKPINDRGFTMPELIIILLGIGLSAMVILPPYLRSPNRAEAKQYVGAMNRAQQAYFLDNKEPEEKGKFANEIGKLELGIRTETENYKYLLRATDSASFHYAIAKQDHRESYIGAVFLAVYPDTTEEITLTIMCEAAEPGQVIPAEPQMENGVPTCGAGTEEL